MTLKMDLKLKIVSYITKKHKISCKKTTKHATPLTDSSKTAWNDLKIIFNKGVNLLITTIYR